MIKYFSDAVKKNISKQFLLWSLRADFSNLGIFWTTEENIITFMNSATGSNHRGNSHSGGRQSKQRAHLYWCAIKRNKVREQSNLHWGEILGNTPRGYTDTNKGQREYGSIYTHRHTKGNRKHLDNKPQMKTIKTTTHNEASRAQIQTKRGEGVVRYLHDRCQLLCQHLQNTLSCN